MKQITTRLGGLECRMVDDLPEGRGPELLVVLCHGYGASGQDLVPLAGELIRLSPGLASRARFLFPAAPLSLSGPFYDARAWWHLDVGRIERAIATGNIRDLRNDHPEGLTKARRMVMALVDEATRMAGLPLSRVVLGGFSQGSMVTTDVALRLEEPPAGLVVLSGTLLMEDEWRKRAPARAGLRVFQSHGRFDELLPFESALWLKGLLEGAGLGVEFVPFDDGHTIPGEVLERLARFLEGVA